MSERVLPSDLMPPQQRPVPEIWVAQRRTHLVGELRPKRRRVRGPRRVLLVPIGAILVAGGAWAAGLFSGGPIHSTSKVVCYEAPSLTSRRTTVDLRPISGLGEPSPRAACVPFFERGFFSAAARTGGTRVQAPRLEACVASGVVSVFPATGPAVCRRLGQRPISDAAYQREVTRINTAFGVAEEALAIADGGAVNATPEGVYVTNGDLCVHPPAALRAVRERLDRSGLRSFRAVIDKRARPSDCISLTIEGPRFDGRTITLSSSRLVAPHPADVDTQTLLERVRRACENPTPRTEREIEAKISCTLERHGIFGGGAGPRCVTARSAKRGAQRVLRRAHLRGWKVRIEGKGRPRGEASVRLVDRRLRLVVITFAPPGAGTQCNRVSGLPSHG